MQMIFSEIYKLPLQVEIIPNYGIRNFSPGAEIA